MADEYISREAVGERLHKLIVAFYSAYEKDGKDERLAALFELDLAARSAMNAIPAADVVEVQRGHWEIKYKWEPLAWDTDPLDWDRYDEKTHSEEVDYYACSKCGYDGGSWKPSWKYCPNCGALMDQDGDGE